MKRQFLKIILLSLAVVLLAGSIYMFYLKSRRAKPVSPADYVEVKINGVEVRINKESRPPSRMINSLVDYCLKDHELSEKIMFKDESSSETKKGFTVETTFWNKKRVVLSLFLNYERYILFLDRKDSKVEFLQTIAPYVWLVDAREEDLNNDGIEEEIIVTEGEGSRPPSYYKIYDLSGPKPRLIFADSGELGSLPPEFIDLNSDGIKEIVWRKPNFDKEFAFGKGMIYGYWAGRGWVAFRNVYYYYYQPEEGKYVLKKIEEDLNPYYYLDKFLILLKKKDYSLAAGYVVNGDITKVLKVFNQAFEKNWKRYLSIELELGTTPQSKSEYEKKWNTYRALVNTDARLKEYLSGVKAGRVKIVIVCEMGSSYINGGFFEFTMVKRTRPDGKPLWLIKDVCECSDKYENCDEL